MPFQYRRIWIRQCNFLYSNWLLSRYRPYAIVHTESLCANWRVHRFIIVGCIEHYYISLLHPAAFCVVRQKLPTTLLIITHQWFNLVIFCLSVLLCGCWTYICQVLLGTAKNNDKSTRVQSTKLSWLLERGWESTWGLVEDIFSICCIWKSIHSSAFMLVWM